MSGELSPIPPFASSQIRQPRPAPQTSATQPIEPVTLDSLSLEEKCALIVFGGIGHWTTDQEIDRLQGEYIRNFIIFGRLKVGLPSEDISRYMTALTDNLFPPLIVSTDQENGFVNRLAWASEAFRYIFISLLASKGDIKSTYETGFITGKIMKLLGFNLNLAPVLDIHADPGRAISNNPAKIAEFALAYSNGLMAAGVGTCAKHFPDGATPEQGDPHKQVIKVNTPLKDLHIYERYQPLINAGIPAIMTSHTMLTAVDPDNPASLSKRWINDILRGEMHFQGLVITDEMNWMKGITESGISQEDAIIRAFNAGADLILSSKVEETRPVLLKAVKEGKISEKRLNESVQRILAFNKRFPLVSPPEDRDILLKEWCHKADVLCKKIQGQ